jgi:hypothetical protein
MTAPNGLVKPVSTKELCARLDITEGTFYRTRGRLHRDDKLPAPFTRHRPFKWDRAKIEAWFARDGNADLRIAQPANDQAPVVAQTADQHRDRLAAVYQHR